MKKKFIIYVILSVLFVLYILRKHDEVQKFYLLRYGLTPQKQKGKICMLWYEDRNDDIYKLTLARNRKYCELHGYDMLALDKKQKFNLPPYWIKVKMALDTLPQYDGVMWIDSDACIHNLDFPVHGILDLGRSEETFFYFTNDIFPWHYFNAGIFLIKNNVKAIQFLNEWMQCYNPAKWTFNKKWSCSGQWAGEDYEQGAGTKLLKSPLYAPYTYKLPWQFWQAIFPNKNTFAMHFLGPWKKRIPLYFQSIKK